MTCQPATIKPDGTVKVTNTKAKTWWETKGQGDLFKNVQHIVGNQFSKTFSHTNEELSTFKFAYKEFKVTVICTRPKGLRAAAVVSVTGKFHRTAIVDKSGTAKEEDEEDEGNNGRKKLLTKRHLHTFLNNKPVEIPGNFTKCFKDGYS